MAAQLVPPFTKETAHKKVKAAQALWNTREPSKIVNAYTPDSIWRNRDLFLRGQEEIKVFLTKKWERETRYRLRKELFAFEDNKIAVQLWYEYYGEAEQSWFRCYGLEDWTFSPDGKMAKRQMSGNEVKISESERWYKDADTEEQLDVVKIGPEHW